MLTPASRAARLPVARRSRLPEHRRRGRSRRSRSARHSAQYFRDKQLGMDGRKPHAAQWDAAKALVAEFYGLTPARSASAPARRRRTTSRRWRCD